ncbi:hypothetical protein EZS27_037379 [termite gut metagenome]|uniref:Uncharacterized protein n=1 Tax=termite gut metagenome TaxID=433724 RepID=A0A5J4PPQ5_9ZZZZ
MKKGINYKETNRQLKVSFSFSTIVLFIKSISQEYDFPQNKQAKSKLILNFEKSFINYHYENTNNQESAM